ncbi:MAG: penicillin-binding transpeptidase domain-containing protein [bacterium]|nr:penicillin-binding transpeptidase domain-containing protein [bacterium]MDE0288044.1 penicillin-binding transpeptidase domain-containing protein [bacterium]MDE0437287.1 penicillin-binding transpeptidase domain-containing protein [bacterium]
MKPTLRVGLLAILFTAGFTVLFIRLWFVQLAVGPEWARQADQNIVRVESIAAPRGNIVDRNGILLATSRPQLVLEVDRAELPIEVENDVIQRLAAILDVSPVEVRGQVERARSGEVALLTEFQIDTDTAYLVMEQRRSLPGVTVKALPVRGYLRGQLMGHVLGHIGLPSAADLERLPQMDANTPIGKLGVEREYDDFLQGTPGKVAYRINAQGDVLDVVGDPVEPLQGATLRLTLDIPIQEAVEEILVEAIELSNTLKDEREPTDPGRIPGPAERAAALVMEVETGAILAMASYPTFEPESFVGGIDIETFDELSSRQAFNNLVIQGLKPPASTFKTITYVTALEEGIFPEGVSSPDEVIQCSPQLEADFVDRSQLVWRNWTYPEADGYQDLHDAIRRSCNIYFWEIALSIWHTYKLTEQEGMVQDWARSLGLGRATQVDLPFENEGILGDRQLFEEWRESQPWRVRREGWLGGDLMNLVVGQGPILATPIQMAVAYASAVNGGTVYQPRVADRLESADGQVIRTMEPRVLRTLDMHADTVESLRTDLASVVSGGTARRAFANMGPVAGQIGGKTGTAQAFTDQDGTFHDSTAWFIGVAPIDDPMWVVAVMVDEGGSGGAVAAPAARAIFQYLLGDPVTALEAGEDTER